MKIEVTEARLKDAGYDLVEGDALTVPDEVGANWCGLGWAKDVDGNVPTGERIVRGAVVEPHNANLSSSTEEV